MKEMNISKTNITPIHTINHIKTHKIFMSKIDINNFIITIKEQKIINIVTITIIIILDIIEIMILNPALITFPENNKGTILLDQINPNKKINIIKNIDQMTIKEISTTMKMILAIIIIIINIIKINNTININFRTCIKTEVEVDLAVV